MPSSVNKTTKTAKDPSVPDYRDPLTKDHIPHVKPDLPEPTPEEFTTTGTTAKGGTDKDITVETEGMDVILVIGKQRIRLDETAQIRFGKVFDRARSH